MLSYAGAYKLYLITDISITISLFISRPTDISIKKLLDISGSKSNNYNGKECNHTDTFSGFCLN